MLGHPNKDEWRRLKKDQFDTLAHEEGAGEDSIEMILDDQIRRRFGEWLARVLERQTNQR